MPETADMWKVQARCADFLGRLGRKPLYVQVSVVLGLSLVQVPKLLSDLEEYDAIGRRSQRRKNTIPQLGSAQRACCLVTECLELGEYRWP